MNRQRKITLYQFSFSHFCEKVRWALDIKGIRYRTQDLLPGIHVRVARQLAPESSLPILVYDHTVVQDSTAIITFLDEHHIGNPLTPADPAMKQQALEWEDYLDEEIGVMLRRWYYYHALPDRKRALRFLTQGARWHGQLLMRLIFPRLRDVMRRAMKINADSAGEAESRWLAAVERLDQTFQERRFLVGNTFTRADLTACALLSPFVAPEHTDRELEELFPARICQLRDQHRQRPYFRRVLDIYRLYR